MKWSKEADQAIQKVPFFVRKRVRKKVETFVEKKGRDYIALSDVNQLKQKFLSKGGMEKEIKGYDLSTCFGGSGCLNTAFDSTRLAGDIEKIVQQADLLAFLKQNVKGDLKFHHEFRIVVADCPNACSRPQIADIGIVGAALPKVSQEPCTLCRSCVDACPDAAVSLNPEDLNTDAPDIEMHRCLACGKCIRECPSGTIQQDRAGFRVMLGGRLGRHPRLAMEIPGIHSHDQVLVIVKKSLKFYKENAKNGSRFSRILPDVDEVLKISLDPA